MNRKYLTTLTLALAALAAGNALAADAAAPKTRDQVRAELAEAQRTGDIVANGNSGKKLNELYPSQYPAKAVTQGNTALKCWPSWLKLSARVTLLRMATQAKSSASCTSPNTLPKQRAR